MLNASNTLLHFPFIVRDEIHKLLNDDLLKDAVLLIYANKQDLPKAMSASALTDHLGLQGLRGRAWYVQPCCATTGDGLYEGLDWLTASLKNQEKRSKY